jgi:hypothetical protein
MPVAPTNGPIAVRTVNSYNTNQGVYIPQTTTTQSTYSQPIANPPVLLGVDAVNFTLAATGTQYSFTFTNLPIRNTSANAVDPAVATTQIPLVIPTGSMLIYVLSLMNAPAWVDFAGYAIIGGTTASNGHPSPYVPAPFLGPATYSIFGVHVTGTAGQTGTIHAALYIQRQ